MILVTRLNGAPLAINADLIERAEATPDTVLTLVDGTKYLLSETIDELVERMRYHRAAVLVRAAELERGGAGPILGQRQLRVVSDDETADG